MNFRKIAGFGVVIGILMFIIFAPVWAVEIHHQDFLAQYRFNPNGPDCGPLFQGNQNCMDKAFSIASVCTSGLNEIALINASGVFCYVNEPTGQFKYVSLFSKIGSSD